MYHHAQSVLIVSNSGLFLLKLEKTRPSQHTHTPANHSPTESHWPGLHRDWTQWQNEMMAGCQGDVKVCNQICVLTLHHLSAVTSRCLGLGPNCTYAQKARKLPGNETPQSLCSPMSMIRSVLTFMYNFLHKHINVLLLFVLPDGKKLKSMYSFCQLHCLAVIVMKKCLIL